MKQRKRRGPRNVGLESLLLRLGPTLSAAARELRVTRQFLDQLLVGERRIPPALLDQLAQRVASERRP